MAQFYRFIPYLYICFLYNEFRNWASHMYVEIENDYNLISNIFNIKVTLKVMKNNKYFFKNIKLCLCNI